MPACGGIGVGSVFASSITMPERQPFVTHIFWPVEHVVVAVADGRRADRLDVRAGVRLGHRERGADLAGGEPRQAASAAAPRCRAGRIIVAAMNEPFMIPDSVTQPRESSIWISA